ncbi:MAG: serine protease [Pseudomonadota bacterium]
MMSAKGRTGLACAIFAAVTLTLPVPAQTQGVPQDFWGAPNFVGRQSTGAMSTEEAQIHLLWLGFYYGRVNGKRDSDTRNAIERFQASIGASATGRLSDSDKDQLRRRGKQAEDAAGIELVTDEWTGITAPIPLGYVDEAQVDADKKRDTHIVFKPKGSTDLTVKFLRYENMGVTAKALRDHFKKEHSKDGREQVHLEQSGNYVKSTFLEDGYFVSYVLEARPDRKEVRGLYTEFPAQRLYLFSPIYSFMHAGLKPFQGAGLSPTRRKDLTSKGDAPGLRGQPDWMLTMYSSGSGSVVSYQGHILTNHHVVDGCDRLTVNGNPAIQIGIDIVNDLALLRAEKFADRDPVRFVTQEAALGDEIIVVGYPLFSLSKSMNSTYGIVSSNVGLRGDLRNIQITAPVQPGNSGGPVVDRFGNQVAVVVSKFSAKGQISKNAENIAWVVRGSIAKDFLARYGVKPLIDKAAAKRKSGRISDVVSRARQFTVRVECHRSR